MKNEVLEFLGNPPKSKPEQFNKALSLYRGCRHHSASQVRFFNSLGYSPDRLELLVYDLKKLCAIKDLDVVKARQEAVKQIEVNANIVENEKIEGGSQGSGENDPDPSGGNPGGGNENPNGELNPGTESGGEGSNDPGSTSGETGAPSNSEGNPVPDTGEDTIGTDGADGAATPGADGTGDSDPATSGTTGGAEDTGDDSDGEVGQENEGGGAESAGESGGEEINGDEKELLERLAAFDANTSYNDMKSLAFAAAAIMGEDPADQKKATLIAFLEAAKKKVQES